MDSGGNIADTVKLAYQINEAVAVAGGFVESGADAAILPPAPGDSLL